MKSKPPVDPSERNDRRLEERVHDPYKATKKLPQPAVCPTCHAVFMGGRWQWKESWPMGAQEHTCEACHRTRDGYPAGIVTLTGAFVAAHQQDLLGLAMRQEEQEKAEHPLNRILKTDVRPDSIIISTTDLHLPKRIADAIHHAYKGRLQSHYDEDGYLLRLNWHRDA